MTVNSTILFPNYNNEYVLPLTFHFLRKNIDCSQVNLIVVDDGSEDNGLQVLKEEIEKSKFANAEIIELEHKGIVNALNCGLSAVKTEFVFRIDGDATVETPGWLFRLRNFLQKYPEIGLIGGQVLFDDYRVHSWGRSALSEYGLYDIGSFPVECPGRRTFDSLVIRPKTSFLDALPYEVDTMLGVCVGFRLSDALDIGGFDVNFSPVWIEDDDFGLGIRLLGKRVIVDTAVQVLHRVSLRGSRQPGQLSHQKSTSHILPLKTRISKLIPTRLKREIKVLVGVEEEQFNSNTQCLQIPTETNTWRVEILEKHYKYWHEKWGFHPLNPNIEDVYERYWDTALCWKMNPSHYKYSKKFCDLLASESFN